MASHSQNVEISKVNILEKTEITLRLFLTKWLTKSDEVIINDFNKS